MAPGFSEFDRRKSPRDGAHYLYLHTPKREPNVIQQRLSILESHKRTARFLYRGPAIQTQRRRKLVGRLRWSAPRLGHYLLYQPGTQIVDRHFTCISEQGCRAAPTPLPRYARPPPEIPREYHRRLPLAAKLASTRPHRPTPPALPKPWQFRKHSTVITADKTL